MIFTIKGYLKNRDKSSAEDYGNFTDRGECYRYLNKLKTGCLSDSVCFFVEES